MSKGVCEQTGDDRTFSPIVMTFSDFREHSPELTQKELERVWVHAQRKMADYFFQDYYIIMDAVVEGALEKTYSDRNSVESTEMDDTIEGVN
jgi:hypothetical protein